MTVSSQTNNVTFVGNGSATAFPLPFRFFSNGDIFAYFIDSISGASTPMVLGTDYTLLGAGEPEVDGGALSLLTTTAPLASMRGLYVERLMPQTQQTDIVNQGEFFASTHEDVFDRLTMLIQQADGNGRGAIRVAIGDPEPARLAPATQRANLLMGFDSIGNPITVAPASGSASELAMNLANDTDPFKGSALVARSAQVAGSIAELRTLLTTSPSKDALVMGYYAPGDGGGGAYYLDSADAVSSDNGGTIIVSADGGRWKLAHGGRVTVEAFGAKGDDATNDSAAIQAAFNYCAPLGLPVHLSGRTYLLGSHVGLPSGAKLYGPGKIHIPANCDLAGAPSYGGAARAIHNTGGASNIELRSVEFFSDGASGSYVTVAPTIALISVSGLRILSCVFRDFGSPAFYAQGFISFASLDVAIMNSKFIRNSGDGAACAEGGGEILFSGNIAADNGDWGFALSNGVLGAKVIGNSFVNNLSTATGADECMQLSFIGNRSTGNEHGIRLAKFAGPFTGDQFDTIISGNVSVLDKFGISVEASSYFSVTGNSIRGAEEQGIRISASFNGVVSGNAIRGSTLENILLSDGSGGMSVSSNVTSFGTHGIRQIGAAAPGHIVSADNHITSASVASVAGITYKTDTFNLGADGKPYFSGPPSINSGLVSLAATGGGVTPPAQIWGYLPIQVGTDIKKIPVYNP